MVDLSDLTFERLESARKSRYLNSGLIGSDRSLLHLNDQTRQLGVQSHSDSLSRGFHGVSQLQRDIDRTDDVPTAKLFARRSDEIAHHSDLDHVDVDMAREEPSQSGKLADARGDQGAEISLKRFTCSDQFSKDFWERHRSILDFHVSSLQ